MTRIRSITLLSGLAVLCLAVLCLAALSAHAQPSFEAHPGNPILPYGGAGDWDAAVLFLPDVVVHEGTYYMFYAGSSNLMTTPLAVGYAMSTDGLAWARHAGGAVFGADGTGFDAFQASTARVLVDGDTWVMYYNARSQPGPGPGPAIGRATAPGPDGPWTRLEAPVLETGGPGAWDADMVTPSAVFKADAGYVMYYSGGTGAFPQNQGRVGRATSPDGIVWTKYDDPATTGAPFAESDPVLDVGPAGSYDAQQAWLADILPTDDGWEMFYTCNPGAGTPSRLCYATSEDGIAWTRGGANPFFTDLQGWASTELVVGSVVRIGGKRHLYYSGHNSFLDGQIGVAIEQTETTLGAYVKGLTNPLGLAVDERGWLWVAEQGTGNDDGRISVVTPDGQVHPFLTGLQSMIFEDLPGSAEHLHFHDGYLWATYLAGGAVLRIDTTGFAPGGPPLDFDAAEVVDVGSFVLGMGFAESNPYDFAFGPGGDLYFTDSAANMVVRRDAVSGELEVFAAFEPLPNPTGVGPPVIEAVPTGIVFAGDRFYVSLLTGFPFVDGLSRIVELDLEGNASTRQEGFTLLTDLALHPENGTLLALQMGRFDVAEGFLPGMGAVFAVQEGSPRVQASGLDRPSAMAFGVDGELYVTSLFTGEVYRLDAVTVTAVERPRAIPRGFELRQNYPNPFNPSTEIGFRLQEASQVRLVIYDGLGRSVVRLLEGELSAGRHAVRWEAAGLPSGVYFYRLEAGSFSESRPMVLLK